MYIQKENGENGVIKDFIKRGVQFVREYQIAELGSDDSKSSESKIEVIENESNSNDVEDQIRAKKDTWEKAEVKEPNIHLSQVDTDSYSLMTPGLKNKVEEESSTKTGIKSKKRRRNQERRQKRLLKYHEKLVKTSGLPPSRLMEKLRLEQKSLVLGEAKRNLACEFEHMAETSPGAKPPSGTAPPGTSGTTPCSRPVPDTGPGLALCAGPTQSSVPAQIPVHYTPPAHPSSLHILMPAQTDHLHSPPPALGCQVPMPQTAITSDMNIYPTLCSSPVSIVGDVSGSMGWSDARPMLGYGLQQTPPGLFSRSSSGSMNQSTLSSNVQTSGLYGMPMTQPQPQPHHAAPAYCFHCLQFGTVFTVNLV